MLRLLAFGYFAIGLIEVGLVPMGKLPPLPGILAGATSIFFGAVLLGLGMIVDELRAMRANRDDSGG